MNLLRALDSDDRVMTGAVMTTFPFAPRFFEGSVLPALRDKDIGDTIAVLADADQYTTTFQDDGDADDLSAVGSESQPQAAGQRYHLAPVSVPGARAFHPKVHYVTGERRVYATVSSANITHPGFTSNREIATQVGLDADGESTTEDGEENTDGTTPADALQRGTKAAICTEIGDFLGQLVDSEFGQSIDPVTQDTIEATLTAGEWVAEIDTPSPDERSAALIHSLTEPVLPQVRERIAAAGETIQQVDIAAPFYGSSLAVPRTFTAEGIDTRLWLQHGRTQIPLAELDAWLDAAPAAAQSYEATRYVHGKLVVIRTEAAAYCLSGSPNASRAALLQSALGGTGNVEAAVLKRAAAPDHFDYLFEGPPFAAAEPVDVETFEPGSSLEAVDDADETGAADAAALELYGVSYRRRSTYDGGRLIVTGAASETVRTALEDQGGELTVQAPGGEGEAATKQLQPNAFDWGDEPAADGRQSFTASTDLYGDAAERPFTTTSRAQLRCGEHTTGRRWVQTYTPTTGEPSTADVADAGATTVPRALTELFEGDEDRRVEVIDSLNALLSALGTSPDSSSPTPGEDADDGGPRGGLSVRPWSQSREREPSGLIESFYEGWEADLAEFIHTMDADAYHFDEVEIRLRAVNAATLQLLLLDASRSDLEVPRQPALNTIKTVYSEQSMDGTEGVSKIADYIAYLQHYADQDDQQADDIYEGLQTQVLPHVLLAAIVVETHVAGDRETFVRQQDWAFEALIGDCFPAGYPTPEHLTDDRIEQLVTTIQEATENIRSRIEESRRLRRHADDRYMDDDRLRVTVIELLGRAILYAGRDAVVEYRDAPRFERQIERVFEEYLDHLPASKRRTLEETL